MSNTITAYFKGRVGVAESVYQNDYGIVMAFDSIDLPAHFDCYFSRLNQEEALPGLGADNRVTIPNSILANPGNVTIHIPLHTGEDDSEVEYVIYFKVIGRARPIDDGTPAQMTAIERALALLSQPITNIEEIVNEALSFTGDTFDEMKAELQEDFDNYTETLEGDLATWKGGVESDIDDVEHDFTVLQNQFDTAVATVSTDTELTDIRVGDDEVTYTTAGLAVRTQFANLKSDLNDVKDATTITEYSYGDAETTSAQGYYVANTTKTLISNPAITTLEYTGDMTVPLYLTCKSLGSAAYNIITYWDSADAQISHDGVSSGTAVYYTDYELTPPSGCTTITVSGFTNDGSTLKLIARSSKLVAKGSALFASNDFVGHLAKDPMSKSYAYIPCYGQSLSVGADSLYVNDSAITGNYMIGTMTTPSTTLNPLKLTANGQHPIVSAINSFSTLYRKYKGAMNFVTGSYGSGGQSIAQLMSSTRQAEIKIAYNYDYNIDTNNNYAVFEASVEDTAIATDGDASCPAIIFMQGERDYYSDEDLSTQAGATVHAYACGGDKNRYKLFMSMLKEDMQTKVMTEFNQTEKPLFCIYEVSGAFVKNSAMTINMAQIEFAEENDDVILLPAPYFTPNYGSAHLATNGYRWYGEYIAKDLFRALCQNSQNRPILPTGFKYDTNHIYIKCSNVVDKLVIDDYTMETVEDSGFYLFVNGGTHVSISDVQVYGDEIIVTTPATLTSVSDAYLSYAGMELQGTGNIRDNDKYVAMYNYWDDTSDKGASNTLTINYRPQDKNGNSMIGKKYPMFNWLQPFYMKVK